jgi:hypothetical protein
MKSGKKRKSEIYISQDKTCLRQGKTVPRQDKTKSDILCPVEDKDTVPRQDKTRENLLIRKRGGNLLQSRGIGHEV